MIRIRTTSLAIIMLISSLLPAQTAVDSLKALLPVIKGRHRVDVLNELAYKTIRSHKDTSLAYAMQALNLAQKLGDQEREAWSNYYIGVCYWSNKDYNSAEAFMFKSLKFFQDRNKPVSIIKVKSMLGNLYKRKGDYEQALALYSQCIDLLDENPNASEAATIHIWAGICADRLGNHQQAIDYFRRALSLHKSIDNKKGMARAYNNIGIVETANHLGMLYIILNNYQQAETFLGRARALAQSLNMKDRLLYNYEGMHRLAVAQRHWTKVQLYFEKYQKLKDDIYSDKSARAIADIETRYKLESKQREIELLKRDNTIQTQLSGTRLLAESIDDLTKDEIRTIAIEMGDSTKNFYELLKNLLTWSMTQMGRIDFNPTYIALQAMIVQNVKLLQPMAQKKKITLSCQANEKLPVCADINMIQSVIQNLISNAIKFTQIGGQVEIMAKSKNKLTTVTIRDTGVGISPKKMDKLFHLDQHITTAGTGNEKGTGLGLILCKEFIEKHKGSIKIESSGQMGQGTVVEFTLPSYSVNTQI
ncbi:tetratricopeptide repeat protein [bacterium]|nr:tetratricopeptide repeat protein [bacterium]